MKMNLLSLMFLAAFAFAPAPAQAGDGCPTYESCKAEIDRAIQESLSAEAIRGAVNAAADELDPPDSANAAEPTAEDPPALKKGQAGDLLKAIFATQAVTNVLNPIKDAALDKVKADWNKLKLGEQVLSITFAAPVALATVTGALGDARLAKPAQDLINAGINEFVGNYIPGLKLSTDLMAKDRKVMLTLDVFELLRAKGIDL